MASLRFLLPAILCASLAAPARAEQAGPGLTFQGEEVLRVSGLGPEDKEGEETVVFESDPLGEDFAAVIFQGRSHAAAQVVVEGALFSAGEWREWRPAEIENFRRGRFWGRLPLSGAKGDRVRLRVRRPPSGPDALIEFFEIEGLPVPKPTGRQAGLYRKTSAAPSLPAYPEPAIVSRGEWGALPAAEPYEPMLPVLLSVHHTAGDLVTNAEDAADELRVIQRYHQRGRGWNDIGYHYLIDGGGRVYRGRPAGAVGAHVLLNNEGNLGVSLLGNFDKKKPTAAQLTALADLLRRLSRAYSIPPDRILAHRDQDSKTRCPGANLYKRMAELRKAAAEPLPSAERTTVVAGGFRLPGFPVSFDSVPAGGLR